MHVIALYGSRLENAMEAMLFVGGRCCEHYAGADGSEMHIEAKQMMSGFLDVSF